MKEIRHIINPSCDELSDDIVIRQGDSTDIALKYLINGAPITEGMCDEMEFYFYNKRYTLSGGDIIWNSNDEAYVISLTQEQTFALPSSVSYQLRVRIGKKVGSSKKKNIRIGDVISREVI